MGILSRFIKKPKLEKTTVTQEPAVVPAIVAAPAIRSHRTKATIAWQVLRHPLVSEKASFLGAQNQYIFVVANNATKTDVRRAVHDAYGVVPLGVNMMHVRGKHRGSGARKGTTAAWKKAIVTLPKDKKIQVYEGV